jgi:hypothetical protein
MKKMMVLFCSCIIVQAVYAQNLIVDDSLNLKRGMYKHIRNSRLIRHLFLWIMTFKEN